MKFAGIKLIPAGRAALPFLTIFLLIVTRIITASFLRRRLSIFKSNCNLAISGLYTPFRKCIPNYCPCWHVVGDLKIECPNSELNIILTVQPDKSIEFECGQASKKDYAVLAAMDIGDTPMAQLRRCPGHRFQSLEVVLERIGARNVSTLLFRSSPLVRPLGRELLRGFSDLNRLVLSGNGLSDLPSDLFADLKKLTWLDLRYNRVHLPPDIFVNLEKLDFLELGYNKLQTLEPGVFRNQKLLKHLTLRGNNLQNLTQDSFECVTSIITLDLSTNELVSIDPNIFQLLTNLKNINLSGNNFTSLPKGLFANNKNLTLMRLLENRAQIETLPSRFLADLPDLEDVRLKARLVRLPGDLFAGSGNVRRISLVKNELIALPENLFSSQSKLLNLDLSRNNLSHLPLSIFANTVSLVVLNLAYNRLEEITTTIFDNLRALKELYLQDNNIYHIHSRAFLGQQHLQLINLQNNHISFNDVAIGWDETDPFNPSSPLQNLRELKFLNLRNNSITSIFRDWIFTLLHLERLDLSYNNIDAHSLFYLQFSAPRVFVNLSHNAIEVFEFQHIDLFNLTQKKESVEIDNNPVLCNCFMLSFPLFIKGDKGSFRNNNLEIETENTICSTILVGRNITSLGYRELVCPLDSTYSKIKRCPEGCTCHVRPIDLAVVIDCSNLGLTSVPLLPNITQFGCNFTELHIENNSISRLPDRNFPGYSHIRELYARNNNISQFAVNNIPGSLTTLDLSNNSLTSINATVFEATNKPKLLKNVSLGNNPWRCDCNAVLLLAFVQNNLERITDLPSMKCSTGREFSVLSLADLCEDDKTLLISACVVAVLGLLFGALVSLYYRYQTEIKVWLYAHNMCLWFVSEEELDKDKKYDAFISYSHKDQDLIADKLQPFLENDSAQYKLCLHERDFVVGEFIQTQIIRSVEDSRRTIIILSQNFLESVWAQMEFQAAHKAALEEGRARLIVVIYGEIGNVENLDPVLRAYLKTNTYLKWGDPWFWDKLRYAMPHPTRKRMSKSTIKSSVDNKLELIKPIPVTPPPLTTPPAEQATKNPLISKLNGTIGNGIGNQYGQQNGKIANGGLNGHVNGAFIINTNAKQSDV